MNESEFRDWARNYLRNHDDRIRKVEAGVKDALTPPVTTPPFRAGLLDLMEDVSTAIRGGGVFAVAVALITPQGPKMSFAVESLVDQTALLGALWMLSRDIGAIPAEMPQAAEAEPVKEQERVGG